ncbi:MAG: hypothetical protein WAU67_16070 [Terracidiphilus sp.]
MRRCLLCLLYFSLISSFLRADGSPFDLSGPKVDVHVKRGDVTLPVSEVPNLLPGDRLWIHPDLPESQATHFVLVVAFLRGSTNPPPPEWFTRVETWTRAAHDEGVFVTVPAEAQQALLFLAPETGGDFNTLRNAVRGRPGSFVRAAQDLQAASWERMRLEAYLAGVRITSQYDPAALKSHTEMAARSLGIKINESCFTKPVDQQASCLSQNSEGMVLDDANAQSLVDQLASGSTLDLMNQLSYTTLAGGGAYSPYIGAIVDTARILSSLHTAHFQYIPALALPRSDTLNLRLNIPPSFRDPKSVVVVALPPVGPARPEPLHPVNPEEVLCALKPGLLLPAEGAPLVFATEYAHNLVLHVESGGKAKVNVPDIPLTVDATTGGLAPSEPIKQLPGGELTGVVRGKWGFDDWEGPHYQLVSPQPDKWTLEPSDQTALVIGRSDMLHIDGDNAVCVEKVQEQTSAGHELSLVWKSPKPYELDVTVPMKGAAPGPVKVAVYEYGMAKPDKLSVVAYDAAASLERLTLSSGDKVALLKGTRLDEVDNAKVNGITFKPAALNHVEDADQLMMNAAGSTSALESGEAYTAHVDLKDGRALEAPVTVDPPRPQVTLLSKGVQGDAKEPLPPVQFGSPNDLPVNGKIVFFLKSNVPAAFPRDEKVEVAAVDGGFHTTLSLNDSSLILEDAATAVGSIEPLARFGASAFGPVRVRAISAEGVAGDWQPLGTLVRMPAFTDLRCPRAVSKPCLLDGNNLFLATSVAATPTFDNPTAVPPDFTGTQLIVPHPSNGTLYVKLRDDPATVQTLTLPVTPLVLPASQAHVFIAPTPAPATASSSATPPPTVQDSGKPAAGEVPATPPADTAPPPQAPASPAEQTPPAKPSTD